MTRIPSTNSSTGSSGSSASNNALNEVNVNDFLKLMIAELQNQDPLNPLENDELIAQLGQIRSVAATDKLTSTLDSVLLGQNIASATNLIGAEVDGLSDDGQRVAGLVERVSVANGQPKLHLDLRPRGEASSQEGEMEAGTYEYRVIWEEGGAKFGLDPLLTADGRNGAIKIGGREKVDQSVLLSNLPITTATRSVYRRELGEEQFQLIGTITNNKAATFLDAAPKDAGSTVLTGAVQQVTTRREFELSLKNVGAIRPPQQLATTVTGDAPAIDLDLPEVIDGYADIP